MTSEPTHKTTAKPKVKRWKVVVGLALIVPIVAVQWLLHSSYLVRVIVDRVEIALPALSVENISGSIAGGLQLDAVYDDGKNQYLVDNLNVQVSLTCLVRKQLCIDELTVATVDIILNPQPATEPRVGAIPLPEIALPIAISVDALQLGRLQILRSDKLLYALNQVNASLALTGSQLSIQTLQGEDRLWRYCCPPFPVSANVARPGQCSATAQ